MNESIYYSVDTLHEAISEGKKISFKYFDYNIEKERVFRRDGARYIVSPIVLSWNEENYYLIAHSDGREWLSHYRVDKMSGVKKLNHRFSRQIIIPNPPEALSRRLPAPQTPCKPAVFLPHPPKRVAG